MAGTYTVRQGDCLSSIAQQFGFADYRAIYNDPQNAVLRSARSNPNLIYPGDKVFIPDRRVKLVDKPTDQLHRFQKKAGTVQLRIKILNEQREPCGDNRYCLVVDGRTTEGRTDTQGMVDQPIASDAISGKLTVWVQGENSTEYPYTWTLEIGYLDPVEEVTGVQARLNNLGFHCGPVDGILGEKTEEALEDFQDHYHLDGTGHSDSVTRRKLRELHDGE